MPALEKYELSCTNSKYIATCGLGVLCVAAFTPEGNKTTGV
jgi:hypothetical protein